MGMYKYFGLHKRIFWLRKWINVAEGQAHVRQQSCCNYWVTLQTPILWANNASRGVEKKEGIDVCRCG